MKPMRSTVSLLCGLACLAAVGGLALPVSADIVQLQKDFQTPPDDARIMVRWWWFGPAVTADGIGPGIAGDEGRRVGGAEIQPTYPLIVDGGTGDNAVKNLKWMSPEFLNMLGVTTAKAKELGLRMDLTLGSGWPYGGPMFTAAEGAKSLQTEVVAVAAGAEDGADNEPHGVCGVCRTGRAAAGGGRGGGRGAGAAAGGG